MKAHSDIGASSMYRWSACPGSVALSAPMPRSSSVYAAEGTAAHDLAAGCSVCDLDPSIYLGKKRTADGHEFVIDEEMVASVRCYLEAGNAVIEPGDKVLIEHRFDLTSVYPGCFGTADRVIWKPKVRELIVDDFKYGKGKGVEVKGNKQGRYYALGALVTLGFPALKVRIRIIQPRYPHPDGPVREEVLDVIDLLDFKADLIDAAKATEDPNAPLHAGDHCDFCPAAAVCPALREQATKAAALAFAPDAPYDPSALAEALALADVVEGWAKSVRGFAYQEAESGKAIPGYKLVAKRATRKWRDVATAEAAFKTFGLGETQMYPEPELRSPAQIEEVLTGMKIKPAGRKELLEPLVVKESSGHALAPESDPRPAVKQSAQEAFAGA